METTRHFTATVYVVCDGATALHHHEKLGIRVPPGGHIDRDELPHEAGLREVREETGLHAALVDDTDPVDAPAGETLPRPRHQLLYDIDVVDGTPLHQHIDHVYYATVDSRDVTPAPGESSADAWAWYTPADLCESDLDADTRSIALDAIRTCEE